MQQLLFELEESNRISTERILDPITEVLKAHAVIQETIQESFQNLSSIYSAAMPDLSTITPAFVTLNESLINSYTNNFNLGFQYLDTIKEIMKPMNVMLETQAALSSLAEVSMPRINFPSFEIDENEIAQEIVDNQIDKVPDFLITVETESSENVTEHLKQNILPYIEFARVQISNILSNEKIRKKALLLAFATCINMIIIALPIENSIALQGFIYAIGDIIIDEISDYLSEY